MNIRAVDSDSITRAAATLCEGGLVVFPTETVYGLGADATNDAAVAGIFALKGRPQFNPLIVHVASVAMAQTQVGWNDDAERLAAAFWPGPLTLVLPRGKDSRVSLLASAGGDTIGMRMPANDTARALIEAAGLPLAAPSANRSGRVSPTTAQHVLAEFPGSLTILDGGPCMLGIESTVLDISGQVPALLRPGSVTRAELESALGRTVSTISGPGGLKSPGMLESHYAPSLPVRLHVTSPKPGEALLAFGPDIPTGAKTVLNLSRTGSLTEAAANLFAYLRLLDKVEFSAIAVMPIPQEGLGVAINDRLGRAAAR